MTVYRDGEPAKRAFDEVRQAKRRLVGIVGSVAACNESWESMPGDACVRRCNRCPKNVYDVEAMNASQIEDLARAVDADRSSAFARFYRRADGRFILGDCPADVARAKTRKRNQRLAALFAGVIVFFGIQAMSSTTSSSADEGRMMHLAPLNQGAPSSFGSYEGDPGR